ncbi:MAG: hypothetical protein ACP5IC_01035 [Minisyncoccia bacterium]
MNKKIILIIFILLVIGLAVFFIYPKLQQIKIDQYNKEQLTAFTNFTKNFENAMKADTYGGKTPEETLNLFIAALEKNDIDLAAKYFALNSDDKSKYYLTRQPWADGLYKAKEKGLLADMIKLLKQAKPAGSAMEGYYGFEIRDENGQLLSDINMIFNQYSKVWKIESIM